MMTRHEMLRDTIETINFLERREGLDGPSGIKGLSNIDAEIMLFVIDVMRLRGENYSRYKHVL